MIIGGTSNTSSTPDNVINLTKGAKINLTKEAPGLKKVMVGLGWDTNKYSGQSDFDLDASVFMTDINGRTDASGFIFYNRLSDVGRYDNSRWIVDKDNSSVIHQGDNLTGEGEGDDEQIYIDLDKIPNHIEKIAITVTIHMADERRQTFGQVENAFCRLVNNETDKEVVHFDLGEDFSVETSIVVGEIYRYNGEWKFNAIGRGFSGGLAALCRNYGLDAAYM